MRFFPTRERVQETLVLGYSLSSENKIFWVFGYFWLKIVRIKMKFEYAQAIHNPIVYT